MDRQLINHFVSTNILSRQDMQRIILRASKDKTSLVDQLLSNGKIAPDDMADELGRYYQLEVLDPTYAEVDSVALTLINEQIAERAGMVPFGFVEGQDTVLVAAYDPSNAKEVVEILESSMGAPPVVVVASKNWIDDAIAHFYLNQPQARFQQPIRRESTQNQWERGGTNTGYAQHGQHSGPAQLRASQPGVRGDQSHPGAISGSGGLSSPGRSSMGARRSRGATPSRSGAAGLRRSANGPGDFDDFMNDNVSPREAFPVEDSGLLPYNDPGVMRDPNVADMEASRGGFFNSGGSARVHAGFGDQEQPQGIAGFDLFDEEDSGQGGAGELTLREIVERHNDKLRRAKDEAQRQREVIQVLVDILVESRVISRKELTRRLKEVRGE